LKRKIEGEDARKHVFQQKVSPANFQKICTTIQKNFHIRPTLGREMLLTEWCVIINQICHNLPNITLFSTLSLFSPSLSFSLALTYSA
jgi:hypothetical protein